MLKPGMVIVTEGDHTSIVSWGVRLFTGSWWTHAFMVLEGDQGIEAYVPRVRYLSISERLDKLKQTGRKVVVLDYPGITDIQRQGIVEQARQYVGRKYDYLQIVVYALTGRFVDDGPLRTVCSRFLENVYASEGLTLSKNKYLAPAELLSTKLKPVILTTTAHIIDFMHRRAIS